MKPFALCLALFAAAPSAFAMQAVGVERSPTAPPADPRTTQVSCAPVTTMYSATPQMACLTAGQRASAAAAAANEQQDARQRAPSALRPENVAPVRN